MKTVIALLVVTMAGSVRAADPPPVTILLGSRHGHVTPYRQGFTHTGGGNIDVSQPSPDTLVITMTGVAVAGAHPCKDSVATLQFDLDQCLEIAVADARFQKLKLTMEGRVIGLLRSQKCGTGSVKCGPASATLSSGPIGCAELSVAEHCAGCGTNLSLNCKEGPVEQIIGPGQYKLHQTFQVSASHRACLWPFKSVSAEFAPDPALDPLWISYWEPFHGAAKKDFGFQVTIKVVPESDPPARTARR